MEQLPEEVREVIFDYVLRDDPDTLFSLRCISKEWKICVDEYVSTFGEWFNACKQEIPMRCFTDIVEKIAPLSAYPWQSSYWMRSRSSTVPKDVYHAWKNLPSLMLDNFQVRKFNVNNSFSDESDFDSGINGDKCITTSTEANEPITRKTRIFDVRNLSAVMSSSRTFDFHPAHIESFTDNNGICRILLELENDNNIYMTDFLDANGGLSLSGMRLGKNQKWCVMANECFTIDTDLLTIAHYNFASGSFHPSEQITLPPIPCVHYITTYITGPELRVFVVLRTDFDDRDTTTMEIYRYKISGNSCGKLSFMKNEKNFYEKICCDMSIFPNSNAENVESKIAQFVNYIPASLHSTDYHELCEAINCKNPRESFVPKDTRGIWKTPAEEMTCSNFFANYLVLTTSKGSVWIYEMEKFDDIFGSFQANATPPKCKVINLNHDEDEDIYNVYIRYVDSKLRIIVDGGFVYYIIDFPGKD